MTLRRHEKNPIITRADIPASEPCLEDVSSVFNPGAVKFGERYLLMLRVQNRGRETHLFMAESSDGVDFTVRSEPLRFNGIDRVEERIHHVYDPRITGIDGTWYIMTAVDFDDDCRLALAKTSDFEDFDFMGIVSGRHVRNGVLFPERIGGRYARLERPNTVRLEGGVATGDTVYLSLSDDLLAWNRMGPVFGGRMHYWDELTGPGPPPVKTRRGWLLVYHGVATHFSGTGIYQAGVAVLDLDDPATVVARSRLNILEPRELYELTGQVPNVVFPSGIVVEDVDDEGFATAESRVLIYYGAADTCICLAETTAGELLEAAATTR